MVAAAKLVLGGELWRAAAAARGSSATEVLGLALVVSFELKQGKFEVCLFEKMPDIVAYVIFFRNSIQKELVGKQTANVVPQ